MRFNILLLSALVSTSFWVIHAAPLDFSNDAVSEPEEYQGKPSSSGFGSKGSVTPTPGKGRDGKIRQTSEVLAVESFKTKEPNHPAAAKGNTANVNDSFHESSQGGATHATVDFKDPDGNHVSRLHISKDGTRLKGDAQPPVHAGGNAAPPNSPTGSRTSSPKPGSSKSGSTSGRSKSH